MLKQSVVLLVPWLLVCSATAQTTPPASGSTIRATTTEVLLDLIVRDKHGKPVKNLKAGEVDIFEDGVRQEIKNFRFLGTREVQQKQKQASATPAQLARPLRATNVICIVFHNLDPVSRKRGIEAVEEFLNNDLQPETYFGVFNLDDRLTGIYPFTSNRTEVLKAAKNAFMTRPMDFGKASEALLTADPNKMTVNVAVDNAAHKATVSMAVTGGEVSRSSIVGADVSTGAGANALRGDQVQERTTFSNIIGMRETDKIITMLDQLGTLPGRKTVLLATTGLMTTGDPERFDAILDRATKAGVTVYPLDVTGLGQMSSAQAGNIALGQVAGVSRSQAQPSVAGDIGALAAMKEKSLQNDKMQDAVRTSDMQASLRALGEGTGGFLIANTNDFRKSFQRIVDDVQSHYEAVYRPTSDKYDGRLRKVEVKVAREDLTVESRTGYFAMPDVKGAPALQPHEMMALAALSSDPLPQAFEFQSTMYRFQKQGQVSHNALAIELPGSSLQATPNPERKTQVLHASLVALVKDSKGQVVDTFSVDSPFEIPEANLAAVRAVPVSYTHPVSLPAGRYTVETAVLDREGGRSSARVIEFENPTAQNRVDLSSVVLVQRIERAGGQPDASDPLIFQGNRIVPLLAETISPDAKPFVYFVVYPNKANTEKPKLGVEFVVDGKTIANQTADLPAPNAAGVIPMVVKAVMHTGKCELKITAIQGTESATRSLTYTVAAK